MFFGKNKSDRTTADYWDRLYCTELEKGKLRSEPKHIERILGWIDGAKTVLDFGSGPGGDVKLLSKLLQNVQFTLVDHSRAALDYAREHVLSERDERGNTFHYAKTLAECPGDYQAVLSFQVLEHLRGVDEVLAALWAKVAPGGLLLISVPVKGKRDHHREHINKYTVDSMLERLWKFSPQVMVTPRTYTSKHGRLATAFFHLTKSTDTPNPRREYE
jgi:2-polyprenyl-3-methyl-5-hydroxy-6-metoxy-1,4-benzoquinol methylase